MRVSDLMQTHNSAYRLNQAAARLFRVQEQASTGLRFTRPSQDPSGAVRAANLRSSLSELDRYLANADIADARLRLTETSVAHTGDSLREARSLALAGLNDGLDDTARRSLAEQVNQISQEIMRAGNAHDGARYLFAGHKLLSPPLVANGAASPPVLYQGDQGEVMLQTGRGASVVANVDAAELLNLNGAADPALEDTFTTLGHLSAALLADDRAGTEEAMVALDAHFTRVTAVRGEIGARLQRVDFDRSRLEETRDVCQTLLSETEGVDLAEVISQLKQEEIAYQTAAAASGMLARASLLDYIR